MKRRKVRAPREIFTHTCIESKQTKAKKKPLLDSIIKLNHLNLIRQSNKFVRIKFLRTLLNTGFYFSRNADGYENVYENTLDSESHRSIPFMDPPRH